MPARLLPMMVMVVVMIMVMVMCLGIIVESRPRGMLCGLWVVCCGLCVVGCGLWVVCCKCVVLDYN